jgi:lipopolysaccharide biosynthesis glycosyltransferase
MKWFRTFLSRRNNTRQFVGEACIVLGASGKNDTYLRCGTLVALKSLRATNENLPIVVLYDHLSKDQRALFDGCELVRVQSRDFRLGTNAQSHLSEATFLRFAIPELVTYRLALYLDSDIVVLDSIAELFELQGAALMRIMNDYVVEDQFKNGGNVVQREGIPENTCPFNAGVIRFDTEIWRRLNLVQSAIELGNKYGWETFLFSDQGLLNLVCYKAGVVRGISRIYNFMTWSDMHKKKHDFAINAKGLLAPTVDEGFVKIVHWTGPVKPWDRDFVALPADEQHMLCGACYRQFADVACTGLDDTRLS